MASKLSETVRGKMALMRLRARLGGGGGKRKGGRRGGGGRRGFFGGGSLAGSTLFELGSVAILGGVGLGAFFRLPVWLSPIGGALWLYGAYRGNAVIKGLGLFIIALGFIDALGVPAAIAAKVEEAKTKGLVPMLGPSSGGGVQKTSAPGGGNSVDAILTAAERGGQIYQLYRNA